MLPRAVTPALSGRTRSRHQVSVVVPVLNEADRLPRLLADLAAQSRPAAEVIVIDGGSDDATAAIAEAAGALTVRATRRGIANQRNEGAARASGDLLVFVDADVRLAPRFIERMVGEMERRDLDAACPMFRPRPGSRPVRAFFAVMNGVFWITAPVAASGGGMLIAVRRDLFVHLGGFDPRYRFEDAHLLRRAGRIARYRIVRTAVVVSDRRFQRDGAARTIATYLVIGVFVALGLFRAANVVDYGFGAYRADPIPHVVTAPAAAAGLGGPRRTLARRLLALSRPRFWPYLLGPWAVGVAAAGTRPDAVVVLLGVYLVLPANLLIYGVNDLYDRETDRLNRKKGTYEALLDPSEDLRLQVAILLCNLPFLVLLPFLPSAAIAWLAVFLVLGIGYSVPPLRLKARPGWDSASNFLYAAPGFAAFTAASGASPPPLPVVAAVLWCAAMHAYSAVPDIDSDRAASVDTIATRLGARPSIVVCLVLWLLSAALVAPQLPAFGVLAAVVYGVLGIISFRAVAGVGRISLFALYRVFPIVNTAVGAALFFLVLRLAWAL